MTHGRDLIEQIVRQAITDGHISPDRDPATETNLFLTLTGLTPLIELSVIEPQEALTAVDQHLNRLFTNKT
ncbi:hypothetical protein [Streptomyces sp. NPDC057557]|uniref:hypothetical protein n=1 Tax=Streptomyces sp. NPDC057557 TaxID=3346167 RepID=UPI003689CDCD